MKPIVLGLSLWCYTVTAPALMSDSSPEERMGRLETQVALQSEFKDQQRSYNSQQDIRIVALEAKINAIYTVRDFGLWFLGVLLVIVPIAIAATRERRKQHQDNLDRLNKIEDALGVSRGKDENK